MALRTRVTTFLAAVSAAVLSLFSATAAYASGGHGEDVHGHGAAHSLDTLAPFSTAGEPLNITAILITGGVLLVIILGLSTLISKAFVKKA